MSGGGEHHEVPDGISQAAGAVLPFKVYHYHALIACCHEAVAAVAVVAIYGIGASIRYSRGYRLWTEGRESIRAGDYPDEAVRLVELRFAELRELEHRS